MKTLALLVFLPSLCLACPAGTHPDSGACAYDTGASPEDTAKWISDEKPPKTTTGEWQTGKFKVWFQPPTVDENIAAAKERDTERAKNEH